MNMDTHMSGSTVKNHISLRMVFEYSVIRRTSYQSWFPVYQGVLPQACLLQQPWHLLGRKLVILNLPQARLLQHSRHLQRKLIIQITLQQSCQAKVWVDKHGETRFLLKHQKSCCMTQPKSPKKTNRNEDHELEQRDPFCSDIREWLQEFRENLVDDRVPEHRNSHASSSHELSSEPAPTRRVGLGRHSVHTYFPKDRNWEISQRTKTTRAPCRRQKRLVIWLRQITEFSVKVVNLEKIIDMQSWCKTWTPNGPSRTRARQTLLKKPEGACKSFWNRIGSLKSFTLTFPWILARLLKIFPGIIVRRHHTETNGIAERAVRRVKESTSAVLLQSGLDEKWWVDSMECYIYLRNIQDLLSDGKTPYERHFGEPFKGPIIPFGSLVEYHPISAKDQSRIHQFGKKVLPGLFLGYALYAGWIWKGDILVADLEELETMDASEMYSKKTQCERGDISQKKMEKLFSNRRWTNQTP